VAPVPKRLERIDGIISLSVGDHHACGRQRNGDMFCWGENASAQLGDGTTIPKWVPVPIIGIQASK
jgi:alpha-tubulin suppressor-like RCC1 family protein